MLTATDYTIIISPLLAYAGFNTYQIKKDKKDENKTDVPADGAVAA